LKLRTNRLDCALDLSPPSRGARIETGDEYPACAAAAIAPFTGGAD